MGFPTLLFPFGKEDKLKEKIKIIKNPTIIGIVFVIISLILMMIDHQTHSHLFKISMSFLLLSGPLIFGARLVDVKKEKENPMVLLWVFLFLFISVCSILGMILCFSR